MSGRACAEFPQWTLPRLERPWLGYRKVQGLECKRIARRVRARLFAGPVQEEADHGC